MTRAELIKLRDVLAMFKQITTTLVELDCLMSQRAVIDQLTGASNLLISELRVRVNPKL